MSVEKFILYNITGDTFERCSSIIRIEPPNMITRTYSYIANDPKNCYVKLVDTSSHNAILYAKLRTYEDCQHYCNSISTCKTINFNRTSKDCYLGFNTSLFVKFSSTGMDHYIRHACNDRCNDTFTQVNKQLSYGGRVAVTVHSEELCRRLCLALDEASHFCFGFLFDTVEASIHNNKTLSICLIYSNSIDFERTSIDANVNQQHFTRNKCTPSGIYEYKFSTYMFMRY